MTDKPTTLSIDPRRWRMLFADNMQVTAAFMASREALSAEDLSKLLTYLDEAKLMAAAWYRAGQPRPAEQPIETKSTRIAPSVDAPKRRGRPPGSGKKQRMSPRVMQ